MGRRDAGSANRRTVPAASSDLARSTHPVCRELSRHGLAGAPPLRRNSREAGGLAGGSNLSGPAHASARPVLQRIFSFRFS